MTPITETAQPVNPAITEAGVKAFFAVLQADIRAQFPGAALHYWGGELKRFAIDSSSNRICVHSENFHDCVERLRAKIAEITPTPEKLRAEAAAKLAEAEAIEAKQGGAK